MTQNVYTREVKIVSQVCGTETLSTRCEINFDYSQVTLVTDLIVDMVDGHRR